MATGELSHTIPLTLRAAVYISASTPGGDPVIAKYAMNSGLFQ